MLVSVIIPSYNHDQYIGLAIESVLRQSYSDIELIVIDDGSSDSSSEIITSFNDSRMRIFFQENMGAHNTINRGLDMAVGDFVTILNSDDVYTLDRIERCVDYLDRAAADLVATWIEVVDGNGASKGIKQGWKNMRPRWASTSELQGYWDEDSFERNIISTNFVSTTSNILFRRALLDRVGKMRNLRFAHDWDFVLRAAAVARCVLLPEALMQYRIHGKNTITSNEKWMLFESCWVIAANIDQFEGVHILASPAVEEELEVRKMLASINVKRCDRMYHALRSYIESRRKIHGRAGDEELLENERLRKVFIELIDD